MPLDLMALAEGSTGSKTPKKNPWGSGNLNAAAAATSSSTPQPSALAPPSRVAAAGRDDPFEAMRKLEELQLKHSSSSSLKAKPPPSSPAPAAGSSSSTGSTSKGISPSGPPAAAAATAPLTAPENDWTCKTCSKGDAEAHGDGTVPGGFKYCPTCGESCANVPSRHGPAPTVTEEWVCHCGEFCPPSFKFCVECGYPAGSVKPPPPDECGGCGETLGESFNFCPDCGTMKGIWNKEATKSAPAAASDDWTCAGCKDGMPADFGWCINCGYQRP